MECEWLGGLRHEWGWELPRKHYGGGKALTGAGMVPQINEGEGMPASGMHEPPVQGAGCSRHQGCAWCTKRWAAPCLRHEPSPVGTVCAVLRGNRAKELVTGVCWVLASTEREWGGREAST